MTLMDSKLKQQKTASSSAINGGVKIIDSGVEAVKNTDSFDHWGFLDEIDAPMWADLTLCDSIDNVIDDPWFDICHSFHECSSSQLISAGSVSIQEPPSPKLPPSVLKSRGKTYKIKEWEKRKYKVSSNKQHPVKTSTNKSSGSTGLNNKAKPISKTVKLKENDNPKAYSSCDSGPKFSNSVSSSLVRQDQEHGSNSRSTLTSDYSENKTSALLSSLRSNLRKSCATRPAARVVNGGRRSEGCKSSSSKSSLGSPLEHGSLGKKPVLAGAQNKQRSLDGVSVNGVSKPLRNKEKVTDVSKAHALSVWCSSNRQGNNTLSSNVTGKGKIQQHKSFGKVLMPRKVNEENQMINKGTEKVRVCKLTASLTSIKETASATMATCQKAKSSNKAPQSMGNNIQRASKQSLAHNNGSEKLIGLKEKIKNRSRDKDTLNPARKVYFR